MEKTIDNNSEVEVTPAGDSTRLQAIKARVHRRLLDMLNLTEARQMPAEHLHHECSERVDRLLSEQGASLSATEKSQNTGNS